MQLTYNGVALHALGRLRVLGERSDLLPADGAAPSARRVSLSVRLDFFSESTPAFATLRAQQVAALAALRTTNARLLWRDETTATTLLDQDATLAAHDLPEDPNAWGSYRQAVTFTFTYHDHAFTPDVLGISYTPTGGTAVTLGRVTKFRHGYAAERWDPHRDLRKRAAGRVMATGRFLVADTRATLEARRTELIAKAEAVRTAFNSKSGTLVYGGTGGNGFNQAVRVTDFEADLDHAENAVDWSLTAEFNHFPDESAYAMADYTVKTREDKDAGTVTTSLAGRIAADSRGAADTKLAALRTLHCAGLTKVGTSEVTEQRYHGNDGLTFTELSFDETYRATSGTAVEWALKLRAAADVRGGLTRHTYSGHVTGSHATSWLTAYQAAVAKARLLGEHQQQMLLASEFSVDDNQQSADRLTTGNITVRVEFSFDYQLHGERSFLESTGEISYDAFGVNLERVSGSIVAATRSVADALLALLLAGYSARLIRGRRVSASTVQIGTDASAVGSTGASLTPPELTGGDTINKNETSVGQLTGMTGQFLKLDFSFEAVLEKTAAELAIKYSLRIRSNYVTREKAASLGGVVSGADRATCQAVVAHIAAAYNLGSLVEEEAGEDREKWLGTISGAHVPAGTDNDAGDDGLPEVESFGGVLVGYTFAREYRNRLSDAVATVLDCEVSEDVEFSGPRWVANETAYGRDVMQACGIKSGSRTVSFRCTATSESVALAWARNQRALPFSGASGMPAAPTTRYRHPPKLRTGTRYVPLTDGIMRLGTGYAVEPAEANVQVWEVAGSFEEVLPEYDYE